MVSHMVDIQPAKIRIIFRRGFSLWFALRRKMVFENIAKHFEIVLQFICYLYYAIECIFGILNSRIHIFLLTSTKIPLNVWLIVTLPSLITKSPSSKRGPFDSIYKRRCLCACIVNAKTEVMKIRMNMKRI